MLEKTLKELGKIFVISSTAFGFVMMIKWIL